MATDEIQGLADHYTKLLKTIVKNSDAATLFDPDKLKLNQTLKHAEIPALRRAWEDYITIWKLTDGD